MSPDHLIWLYELGALALLSGAAVYSTIHRRRFDPEPTSDHIYRCAQCAMVYTDDVDVELSKCPQCGEMNEPMQY